MNGKTAKNPNKLRFAPSPNGLLHIGHAYSALLTSEFAKQFSAVFQLRIEDIDLTRSKSDYITAIYRDLHWLGLTWPEPVRRQSEHFNDYKAAIAKLNAKQLLYPCFATRSEIKRYWSTTDRAEKPAPKDPDGALLYPGIYKNFPKTKAAAMIASGAPYALRLDMEKAIAIAKSIKGAKWSYQDFDADADCKTQPIYPEQWGDVILARKDVPTSYHLSVVIDDHNEGISHVCRGKDLQPATDVHRLLQILLGLNAPLYHHHALIQLEGEKLSKSKKHPSLFALRKAGISAAAIRKAAKQGPETLTKYLP